MGLDIAGGAALAVTEKFGDWYRDPWSWPEISTNAITGLDAEGDLGLTRNDKGEYHLSDRPYFHLLEIPKSWLGVRPAVVQDPLTHLAYLAAVSPSLRQIHDQLPSWVYGWRSRSTTGLAINGAEWTSYIKSLPIEGGPEWGLQTDLTSFFASVRPEFLREPLRDRIGNSAPFHVIMDVVEAHDALSSRSGLPQRSFASAALAHAILRPIDDALAVALMGSEITVVRRWMDDISAEGSEQALYALLMSLNEKARQIGLELNSLKTRLLPATESAGELQLEGLREIEVPTKPNEQSDYGHAGVTADLETLLRLQSEILAKPDGTKRSVTRAVLKSLRDQAHFDAQESWRENAHRLPHVADALSRYLRDAAEWGLVTFDELGDWFAEYNASTWGRLDWVSSQYALIFPGNKIPDRVQSILQSWLTSSSNLQQVAVASQRLSASQPIMLRDIVRSRLDRTNDPLILRVFALSLLAAGGGQSLAERALRKDDRNRLMVRLLEAQKWQPLAVAPDFDAGAESDH